MRVNIPLEKWEFSIPTCEYAAAVYVPHTWNVTDAVMHHRGSAEYAATLYIDAALMRQRAVLHCNAAYHTAQVWVNGALVGRHSRAGYTPFEVEISSALRFGADNTIKIAVDNTHTDQLLPSKDAFDWADDGGLIRKVWLEFTDPRAARFLHVQEHMETMQRDVCSGRLEVRTTFCDGQPHAGTVRVIDGADDRVVLEQHFNSIEGSVSLPFQNLKLWSCQTPNLYRVALQTEHDYLERRVGLRTIAVEGERILLNGKPIYLKGCEWMPGSHPDFGMAEPMAHSEKCLRQLKDAGCVFTRFHWQQDDALLDWCDENGLLVQEEIPFWGHPKKPTPLELDIARQQAQEMVYYHQHHPSIIFWGVGNELGGEFPETIEYVKAMVAYFKSLDGRRLVNYVSNSISRVQNADKDDATRYGDVAMWNDYLGLWEPSEDVEAHAMRTAQKCAGMPLVVSEFGLCEPAFSGGDARRAEILKQRLALYEKIENIQGYVWFSLNDYRTHVGEEGEGKLRRRVHGSTDLYGNEKPSYRMLCDLQK